MSKGVTHYGSHWAVNVTFGAFMGSGRADHALVPIRDGNVWVDRWENKDHGGTMARGDGAFYCDMTGDGSDDYLFVNANGSITLFENNHNWGYWIPWGVIYQTYANRRDIHLADFDGDGKCDVLLVDKDSGATHVILNQYSSNGFQWKDITYVTGGATCTEGYGTYKHDRGVRWNDIDGDGRADFLCMQTNGVVHGYLNKGVNNMINLGLVKHEEGKERKNLRFADINGDGRDDFLYVNMLNGAVTVWYNAGQIQSSGSAFRWDWAGVVSPGGSCRGECIEFGAEYGQGRAGYISEFLPSYQFSLYADQRFAVLEAASNKAWTWL